MFYKSFNPESFLDDKNKERDFIQIAQSDDAEFKIAVLKKNYEIDTHTSDTDVTLYLVDGEIELNFMRSDDCGCSICSCKLPGEDETDTKVFRIKKGEMFKFEKNMPHSVKALKDSLFFLIRI